MEILLGKDMLPLYFTVTVLTQSLIQLVSESDGFAYGVQVQIQGMGYDEDELLEEFVQGNAIVRWESKEKCMSD